MAIKVGSFAKSTAAATASQAITGVGFTPTVLIMWTTGNTTANTWEANHRSAFGITTGASNSYSGGFASVDAAATSNSSRRMAAKALTIVEWGEALLAECDLTSFDADGFTLSWTTNNASAYIINYIAISGTTGAKVVNWTSKTGTTGNLSVTGAGFQPDLVIHFHAAQTSLPTTSAGAFFNVGAMDTAAQWLVHHVSQDAQATSNTHTLSSTTYAVGLYTVSGSVTWRASYVSMDADGFTVNFANVHASAWQVASLCLKFASGVDVGTFNSPTSTGNQAITGTGFVPGLLAFFGVGGASGELGGVAFGAHDGSASMASVLGDVDALADTSTKTLSRNDKAIAVNPGFGFSDGTDNLATVASLDADGFTLSWLVDTATASPLFYVALGAPPATATTSIKMMHYKRLRQ